jgi:glycerophosphoryl diester phosphodiesterase
VKQILAVLLGLVIVTVPIYFYLHRTVNLETQPIILGHGGMGVRSTYPLNTNKSVNRALQHPVDGVELDARLSADGILFAVHDNDLDGNTNCSGTVSSTSSKELLACNFEAWFKEFPVYTVEQFYNILSIYNASVSLDLKSPVASDSALHRLSEQLHLFEANFPKVTPFYETSDIEILRHLKQAGLKSPLLLNHQQFDEATELVVQHKLDGIIFHMDNISKDQVVDAQQQGLIVAIWGCGSVFSNRKALEMGADIIQTDDLPSMMRLLDRN